MNIDVWVGGRCYALDPMVRLKRKIEERLNRAVDERQFEAYLGLARYDLAAKLDKSLFDNFDEETLVKRVVERFREDYEDDKFETT
jgi:hypothetical protein